MARLEAACFTHPWNEAQFAEEITGGSPGEERLVLVLQGPGGGSDPWAGIRAYGSFRLVLDEIHVMNVAVAPGQRKRGLARWLLAFAMRKAARAGARRALLEVRAGNGEALALYESLGFRRVAVRRGYCPTPRMLLRAGTISRPRRARVPAEPPSAFRNVTWGLSSHLQPGGGPVGACGREPRTGLRRPASKRLWKTRSVFQAGVGAHPRE
jgi:ribosomal-protein-alanine N-acetyltransferase